MHPGNSRALEPALSFEPVRLRAEIHCRKRHFDLLYHHHRECIGVTEVSGEPQDHLRPFVARNSAGVTAKLRLNALVNAWTDP